MLKKRNDFTIRPNDQPQRKTATSDLWDIVIGRSILITTVKGKLEAQSLADKLNEDSHYLYRGQTRSDKGFVKRVNKMVDSVTT